MLTNLLNAIEEIKVKDYKVTQLKNGGENIQQTQRNELGGMLKSALSRDFAEMFPISEDANSVVAYVTSDGAIIEIPNESIRDKITNPDGSGAISIEISVKVKSLDYNAQNESEAYQVILAEKMAKAQAKAEEKAKKIARDVAARKKKAEG